MVLVSMERVGDMRGESVAMAIEVEGFASGHTCMHPVYPVCPACTIDARVQRHRTMPNDMSEHQQQVA